MSCEEPPNRCPIAQGRPDPYTYTDQVVGYFKEAHQREHALLSEAIRVAQSNVDKRLEAMNQLREQINQERTRYMARDYYEREHKTLSDRVTLLEQVSANFQGRLWMMGAFIGFAIAVISWVVEFLRK